MNNVERVYYFTENDLVTSDTGEELSPLDDDYFAFKSELEDMSNPLSDDYCKHWDY